MKLPEIAPHLPMKDFMSLLGLFYHLLPFLSSLLFPPCPILRENLRVTFTPKPSISSFASAARWRLFLSSISGTHLQSNPDFRQVLCFEIVRRWSTNRPQLATRRRIKNIGSADHSQWGALKLTQALLTKWERAW